MIVLLGAAVTAFVYTLVWFAYALLWALAVVVRLFVWLLELWLAERRARHAA